LRHPGRSVAAPKIPKPRSEVVLRLLRHLSYANVVATLALFLALGGTAVAGSKLLITGNNVRDHSLTGVDIKNGSLGFKTLSPAARTKLRGTRGAAGPTGQHGSQGSAGPQGVAGPQGANGIGVTTATAAGADVTGYQDFTPLASFPLPVSGDYVIFTTLTVHNTGVNDEYLNCGFRLNGTINPSAGINTTAGGTAAGFPVGALHAPSPGTVEFLCYGNGNTSYDISGITMRIHYLG
jgi:hypothetical protein